MPPLAYETAAWLRFYTGMPLPALPGEIADGSTPDPSRTAYAAPVAGALIGAVGGLVVAIAAGLGIPHFFAAALGVIALVATTGGRPENALAAAIGRRTSSQIVQYGVLAIAAAALLRAGALDGLLLFGIWETALTLVAACAVSRATALAFLLMRPAASEGTAPAAAGGALQWLAISGLAIGIATVLPFHGLGAAIAGIAAAAGAVALVSSLLPPAADPAGREFAAVAELVSEVAFLVAVLAFASN